MYTDEWLLTDRKYTPADVKLLSRCGEKPLRHEFYRCIRVHPGGLRSRALREETSTQSYVGLRQSGSPFPPIVLDDYDPAAPDGTQLITDGNHRVSAACCLGELAINAFVPY